MIRLTGVARYFALFCSCTFFRISANQILNHCVNLVSVCVVCVCVWRGGGGVFYDTILSHPKMEKMRNDVLKVSCAFNCHVLPNIFSDINWMTNFYFALYLFRILIFHVYRKIEWFHYTWSQNLKTGSCLFCQRYLTKESSRKITSANKEMMNIIMH